jgi:hypothetical protein
MAVTIELRTDSFAERLSDVGKSAHDFSGVRRPLRGIEIKNDTYGVIRVIKSDGTEIPLVDAGGSYTKQSGYETTAASGVPSQNNRPKGTTTFNYSNFIIQTVVDSRQEKQQIMETFGDSYIFFFGERPRVLQVTGVLFNTLDFNWRTEFWYNYEKVLRGSKLVQLDARVYLRWDDIVVEGYILAASAQDDASNPYHIPFSFSMFVTNHMYLSQIGDDAFPIRNSTLIQPLQSVSTLSGLQQAIAGEPVSEEISAAVKAALDVTNAARGARRPLGTNVALNARLALNQAATSGASSKFNVGKNILANAIALGVNSQRLTFLSLVNKFFNQRRVRFPRGIAGSNVGKPEFSGLTRDDTAPKRTKKIRSKIRDNVDEYIGGTPTIVDEDMVKRVQQNQNRLSQQHDLEETALSILSQLGIDPIQHGKPETANIFTKAHNLVATEGKSFDSSFVEQATLLGFQT